MTTIAIVYLWAQSLGNLKNLPTRVRNLGLVRHDKDKIAAGFTNSASMNGDKHSTLHYMITLAMQQGMLWVGIGMVPSNSKAAARNDINYLGSYAGPIAQSPSYSTPEEGPSPGDLETATLFGKRVAEIAKRCASR